VAKGRLPRWCGPLLPLRRWRLRGYAGCVGDPDKQVFLVLAHPLPHLEEAVHRITDKVAVRGVARNLERSVGQIGGKARIRYVAGQPRRIGRVGLRQQGVVTRPRRIDAVGAAWGGQWKNSDRAARRP
jgi:hypothetical protein